MSGSRSTCATPAARAGDEVVQLYVRDDAASITRPVIELKRFQRVTLQPGEQRTVAFDLTPDDLALLESADAPGRRAGHVHFVVRPGFCDFREARR